MKIRLWFCLICFLGIAKSDDDSAVKHYLNLFAEKFASVFSYVLPEDSSAFRPYSDDISVYGTFDYIIVGAGSAGAVIAGRLSELEEHNVLLIEAGGYENDFTDIPAAEFFLQRSEYNWNYNSTPQTDICLGMINNECPYPRGKGVGGTSILNDLTYARGNRRDYDSWCNQGNPGWSYEDVLPYFKKSEKSHIDGDEGYHGKEGNWHVEYHRPNSPQFDAFIEANLELGRKLVDYNGREQLGVGRTQVNTVRGRRDSASKAFLLQARNRPNLKILPYSLATKILIDPTIRSAYGVLFSHGERLLMAIARQEVIISAGTIGSPQLLMLSGIGPAYHLQHHRIPVVQSLPVGNNFQDHVAYLALNFETNYTEPVKSVAQYITEFINGYGPLTGRTQGMAFLQTSLSSVPGRPDVEVVVIPSNNTGSFAKTFLHLTDETYSAYAKVDPTRTFSLLVLLLHPRSRGTLTLKSNDPYDYPLINPRSLTDGEGQDIENIYRGIQLAIEMANTNAFKKLNTKLVDTTHPACRDHEYLSKPYWYCQIKYFSTDIFHPVGTCKMGPDPLGGAVVNHELEVHGIRNLRVADASVIPEHISGHTNAPAIMIGEKASDMIKDKLNSNTYLIMCSAFSILCRFLLGVW